MDHFVTFFYLWGVVREKCFWLVVFSIKFSAVAVEAKWRGRWTTISLQRWHQVFSGLTPYAPNRKTPRMHRWSMPPLRRSCASSTGFRWATYSRPNSSAHWCIRCASPFLQISVHDLKEKSCVNQSIVYLFEITEGCWWWKRMRKFDT